MQEMCGNKLSYVGESLVSRLGHKKGQHFITTFGEFCVCLGVMVSTGHISYADCKHISGLYIA
jgi:predicted nucleic acid-binding Zn finger protein